MADEERLRLLQLVKLGDVEALEEVIRIYKRDRIRDSVRLKEFTSVTGGVINELNDKADRMQRLYDSYLDQLFYWIDEEKKDEPKEDT
jgi:hypothetical protein